MGVGDAGGGRGSYNPAIGNTGKSGPGRTLPTPKAPAPSGLLGAISKTYLGHPSPAPQRQAPARQQQGPQGVSGLGRQQTKAPSGLLGTLGYAATHSGISPGQAADVAVHATAAKNYLADYLNSSTAQHMVAPLMGGEPQVSDQRVQGLQAALKLADTNSNLADRYQSLQTLKGMGIIKDPKPASHGGGGLFGTIDDAIYGASQTFNHAYESAAGAIGSGLGDAAGYVFGKAGQAKPGGVAGIPGSGISINQATAPAGAAARSGVDALANYLQRQANQRGVGTGQAGTGGIALLPAMAGTGVASALIHHPGDTLKHTATGLRDAAVGSLSAIVGLPVAEIVDTIHGHPEQPVVNLAKQIAADYSRRYGTLLDPNGLAKFAERIRQQGAAGEVLDAVGVKAIWDHTMGRTGLEAMDTGAKARGSDFFSRPRPALQLAGNTSIEQTLAKTPLGVVRQRVLDSLRADHANPSEVVQPGENAVRPLTVAGKRGETKIAAAVRSQGTQALRNADQAHVLPVVKAIRKLDPHEQQAAFYAMQGELPANALTHGPQILEGIQRKIADITQQRSLKDISNADHNNELATLEQWAAHPESIAKAFTPKVQQFVQELHPRDVAIANAAKSILPGEFQAELRRTAPMAQALGIRRGEIPTTEPYVAKTASGRALQENLPPGAQAAYVPRTASGEALAVKINGVPKMRYVDEAVPNYLARLEQARVAAGHEKPVYVPGELYGAHTAEDFGSKVLGGQRFSKPPARYEGELQRIGRRDTSLQNYVTGLRRTIKAPINDLTVQRQIAAHVPDWANNKTLEQIRAEAVKRGIDPNQLAFYHHGVYQQARAASAEASLTGDAAAQHAADLEHHDAAMGQAFFKSPHDIPGDVMLHRQTGWSALSRPAYNEITTKGISGGKLGRLYDVQKGMSSRAILGSSPPWLQYQAMNQAVLTGFATMGRGLVKAASIPQRWNSLTEGEKAALGSELDPAYHFSPEQHLMEAKLGLHGLDTNDMDVRQAHLGSMQGRFLQNLHSAYMKTGFGRAAARLPNPLSKLIQTDLTIKRGARKAYVMDLLEHPRTPYLNQALHDFTNSADRAQPFLAAKTPLEFRQAMLKDPQALHEMATHVNDIFGNFTDYTHFERNTLNRFTMFYGFLRYSMKMLLYTMPVKHPLVTSVIGNLGRLQADEIRKLAGDAPGGGDSSLPFGLGTLRFGPNGELAVDLVRGNPVVNAVTNIDFSGNAEQVLGFTPPIIQTLFTQISGIDPYTGTPLNIRGGKGTDKNAPVIEPHDRALMLAHDIANLFTPYRAVAGAINPEGKSQADSLLGIHPAPLAPTTAGQIASQQTRLAEDKKLGPTWLQILRTGLFPEIPKNDSLKAKAQRAQQFKATQLQKAGKGSAPGSAGGWSPGGSGSGGWNGGAASSPWGSAFHQQGAPTFLDKIASSSRAAGHFWLGLAPVSPAPGPGLHDHAYTPTGRFAVDRRAPGYVKPKTQPIPTTPGYFNTVQSKETRV